ncbi:hypothetical protein JQ625_24075 [Bradyrhizobium diazoefficiens]|nr:hypothetical protein [Bradyrhizobium diazoefficiens]MBR0777921.1 hypothetical protein [Bradyrhizobium diazoefficiens]
MPRRQPAGGKLPLNAAIFFNRPVGASQKLIHSAQSNTNAFVPNLQLVGTSVIS